MLKKHWEVETTAGYNRLAYSFDCSTIYHHPFKSKNIIIRDAASGAQSSVFDHGMTDLFTMRSGWPIPEDMLVSTGPQGLAAFDGRSKREKFTFPVAEPFVPCPIDFNREATLVAETGGRIGVYSLKDGQKTATLQVPVEANAKFRYLDCTRNGLTIVALTEFGKLYAKIHDATDFRPIFQTANERAERRVTLSPGGYFGGSLVALCSEREPIRILETDTGNVVSQCSGHTAVVKQTRFANRDRWLLSISLDKTFRVWDVWTGKELYKMDLKGEGTALELSQDGKFVALATQNEDSLQLWRLSRDEEGTIAKKDDPKIDSVEPMKEPKIEVTKKEPENTGKHDWNALDLSRADESTLPDGYLRLSQQKPSVSTKKAHSGDVDILVVARTNSHNIRLDAFKGACVIFNWEGNPSELRVNRPNGRDAPESGTLLSGPVTPLERNSWHKLRWIITKNGMRIYSNNQLVFEDKHGYDLSAERPIRVRCAHGSIVDVQSFVVSAYDPDKPAVVVNPPDPEPKIVKKEPEPMPKPVDALTEVWKVSATSFLTSLSFSNDGTRLATASQSPDAILLDARNGSIVDRQKIADAPIASLTFATSNRLFVVDQNRRLSAWDLAVKAAGGGVNGTCGVMQFPIAGEKDIIFLPNQKASVDLYLLKEFKKVGSIPLDSGGDPIWMSVTADGENVVLATNGGEIFAKVKDTTAFKLLTAFGGGGQRRVAIAPDGKSFAFSMNKEPIRILDIADGKELKTLAGHTHEMLALGYLADGKHLVSLARDEILRLWDVEAGKQVFEAKTNVAALAMAISPDGKSVAVGGSNGTQLWKVTPAGTPVAKKGPDDPEPKIKIPPKTEDNSAFRQIWSIEQPAIRYGLAFSKNGSQVIATPGNPAEIHRYDFATGGLADKFVVGKGAIHFIGIAPNDRLVVSETDLLAVWDLKTKLPDFAFRNLALSSPGALRVCDRLWISQRIGLQGYPFPEFKNWTGYSLPKGFQPSDSFVDISLTLDAKTCVAITGKGEIFLRRTNGYLRSMATQADADSVVLSADGKHLLVSGSKSPARLYETPSGAELHKLDGVAGVFSADGRHVLTVSKDGALRAWNVQTGKPLRETKLPGPGIGLAISPDGKHVVTSTSGPNSIQLRRLPSEIAP